MALLVVLAIVALLTSLLAELAFSTLVDLRLTETFRDTTRAYYLARGGITAGRMILQEDRNNHDGLEELWSQGVSNYPVHDGSVSVHIIDQDGKLGINALVNGDMPDTLMVDRFYRLFLALELADPAGLTANLIDWLDSGSAPYTQILTGGAAIPVSGAEDAYYQGLSPPYPVKNGRLDTLDELSLIKDFTPEVLRLVLPHVGLHDSMAVNINTASGPVLRSLDPLVTDAVAETLIKYRQETPIENLALLDGVIPPGAYSALKSLGNLEQLGVRSRSYRIEAEAQVNDGRRRLQAEVDKQGNRLLLLKVN
ncbi:MAG: type II secretion system minor pseudopilin GspK [Desulfurivibrionaceae bacterium]